MRETSASGFSKEIPNERSGLFAFFVSTFAIK
jgi:hypothetical protein